MSTDGSIRCGPFELSERIGVGGMAEVWRAEHVRHGEPAAVKIVKRLSNHPELEPHFAEEVRTHAELHHPSIIEVYDHGRVEAHAAAASDGELEAGRRYLAMEYADMGTVADLADPADWPVVDALIRNVLDGLAHVHARDLVHRDLKPENVLVVSTTDGADDEEPGVRFKLADFGITHAFDALEKRSDEGVGLDDDYYSQDAGTPVYMAPEQFVGEWQRFGPWTDLYQLGMILWELVCGDPPFEADSPVSYGYCHMKQALPAFEPIIDVPDEFRAWLGGLVAKMPENRFQRAADATWHFERIAPEIDEARLSASLHPSSEELEAVDHDETTLLDREPPTLAFVEAVDDAPDAEASEDETTDVVASTAAMTAESPPPIPETWRTPESSRSKPRELEAGLGMFDVRDVPLVDRDSERDALWSDLREVVEDEACRVVVLDGPDGAGKSRLARWVGARAHEVGVVTPIRAHHGQPSTPRSGIVDLVERYFRLWGAPRDEALETVREILEAVAGSDPSIPEEDIELDARAFTELVRPADASGAPGEHGFGFGSEHDVYALMTRLLEYVGTRRPPLVWLDDIHWGPDSLEWIDWLLDSSHRPAVLFALTLRADPEGNARVKAARDWVDRRADDDRVRRLSLGPFDAETHRAFVESMLPFEEDLAERIASHTEGIPLFARELVGEWIQRDWLELSDDRFALGASEDDAFPESLQDVWLRRLDRVVSEIPEAEREPALEALELAAVLGRYVRSAEWEAATDRLESAPPNALLEELADAGLIESAARGWAFTHTTLVDALVQRSREAGRLEGHHARCAAVIDASGAPATFGGEARLAWHLEGAARRDQAIDALLEAAERANDTSNTRRLREYVEQIDEWLESTETENDDPRRTQLLLLQAFADRYDAPDRALDRLDQLEAALDEDPEPELRARSRLLRSGIYLDRGRLPDAVEQLDGAAEPAAEAGKHELAGHVAMRHGQNLQRLGRHLDAARTYRRANRLFQRADTHSPLQRELALMTGLLQIEDDRFEEAEEHFEALEREAWEAGDLDCLISTWNALGECMRFRSEWDEAVRYYRKSHHWARRQRSDRLAQYGLMNLALVYVAADRFEEAAAELDALEELIDAESDELMGGTMRLARLACCAAEGDWERWDATRDELDRLLDRSDARHRDLPKTAETAADLADSAGHPERAHDLLRLARTLWRDLDADEHVERLDSRLGEADS